MREVKFRAWNKEPEHWIDIGSLVRNCWRLTNGQL